ERRTSLTDVMWRLMNEEGMRRAELIQSDGYAEFVTTLWDEARALDASRPIVENDFIGLRHELVRSDIRTPHWYGRATREFLHALDGRLDRLDREEGPVYVTEFGEWGLPAADGAGAFWDQQDDLRALVGESSWPGTFDELVEGTQAHQGWADRVQGERLRTSPHVRGFCVTEWTDVPHELNGLVSLRRTPKQPAIDGFRTAAADVAPIATLARYSYAVGETVTVQLFVSNWSPVALSAGRLRVALEDADEWLEVPRIPAGDVVAVGAVALGTTKAGPCRLSVRLESAGADTEVGYPIHLVEPAAPRVVEVRGSAALADGLAAAGWTVTAEAGATLVIGERTLDADGATALEAELGAGRRAVVLAQDVVPVLGAASPLNPHWGPTPYAFTDGALATLGAARVLQAELFHCGADAHLAEVEGGVGVLVPPPTGTWGALVAGSQAGAGALVACQLRIESGCAEGYGFDLAVLSELVGRVEEL
ncbi:MAG TPA: hypothetical protein VM030_07725, partial [Acidimicrobiales bacterium]|nr:hypothetical protein [Acidimicrobiales bacterium]